MGYDITRFQGEVDEELICPICSGVLEEPLHVSIRKIKIVSLTCLIMSYIIVCKIGFVV